jgi:hypothetical protein
MVLNNFMIWRKLLAAAPLAALAACAPKIPEDPVGNGGRVGGVSPTSVQLVWDELKTAESYRIYNLRQGSQPIYNTTFPQATITPLSAETDYTLSVRGVRGTAANLSDPLDTYTFKTWKTFEAVAPRATLQLNGGIKIEWEYAPWTDGVKMAKDAEIGSDVYCSLNPLDSNTSASEVDPFASRDGVRPLGIQGPLVAQSLSISQGDIDARLAYAAQCEARFIDNTVSRSTYKFTVPNTHQVSACPTSTTIGTGVYSCNPGVVEAPGSAQRLGDYTLSLLPVAGSCSWARLSTSLKQIEGSPGPEHIGQTCNLVYVYRLPDIDYVSPRIITKVTVIDPSAYTIFPSFAVRAISGALGFPKLANSFSMPSASAIRARVKGDIITDFGYGSAFFVGGSDPFPELNGAGTNSSNKIQSSFFYGFPLSPVSGTRPNGFSFDAVRDTLDSKNGSVATEGFVRGNLVVPAAQITNPGFLAKAGYTSGVSLSLRTFLSQTYTYDGGSQFSPVPLTDFLRTLVDMPLSGTAPSAAALWNGAIHEPSSVVIRAPTAAEIEGHAPASATPGGITSIVNADPAKNAPLPSGLPNPLAVTGLVPASVNSFDFYATNCPADADSSDPVHWRSTNNPTACAGIPNRIRCYGDVIVRLPLRLIDAVIETDEGGCRIYSTNTVFIQGTIRAQQTLGGGITEDRPLQISSSRAVVIGFSLESLGVEQISGRSATGQGLLNQTYANGNMNPFLTRTNDAAGSAAAALNLIGRDARIIEMLPNDYIGTNNLYAASDRSLSYLAVNAPYVFNNYTGTFTGSVIAEVALFKQLNFVAEPRFKGVTPFPLLTGAEAPLKVVP